MHGTQKPVEAMRRPMLNNSAPGQPVYEPFSGSGTSIIAAETCGRISLSMELDPAYVDVAVTRWQSFTGETATLDGDGRSFAEIAPSGTHHEPGRRPKPTAIRRLEGNRGKRAWNHAEPMPPDALPRCPEHLSESPAGSGGGWRAPCTRMGVLTTHRPRRARRLLPGLRPLGRGRGEAEGDARRSTRPPRATCSSRPGSPSPTSSSS